MDGVGLAAIIAVVAGYVSGIYFIVNRIDARLERVEERLTAIEVTLARIDQRLADHLIDH